jgi:hypothetical protein
LSEFNVIPYGAEKPVIVSIVGSGCSGRGGMGDGGVVSSFVITHALASPAPYYFRTIACSISLFLRISSEWFETWTRGGVEIK